MKNMKNKFKKIIFLNLLAGFFVGVIHVIVDKMNCYHTNPHIPLFFDASLFLIIISIILLNFFYIEEIPEEVN